MSENIKISATKLRKEFAMILMRIKLLKEVYEIQKHRKTFAIIRPLTKEEEALIPARRSKRPYRKKQIV